MGKVLEGICITLNLDKDIPWVPKEKGSFEKIQNFWDHSKKYVLNAQLVKTLKSYDTEKILTIP